METPSSTHSLKTAESYVKLDYCDWRFVTYLNGMLRHSLATLEESRNLWHFIEPSFAFGASSLTFSLIALSFLLPLGGCVQGLTKE